jgi:hypothetical protein
MIVVKKIVKTRGKILITEKWDKWSKRKVTFSSLKNEMIPEDNSESKTCPLVAPRPIQNPLSATRKSSSGLMASADEVSSSSSL